VAANKDGRLEVFVRATAQIPVMHCATPQPGQKIGPCIPVMNCISGLCTPLVVSRQIVMHTWQVPGGAWYGWNALDSLDSPNGKDLGSDPAVGVNQDDRLEVFALGSDNVVYHIWQTCAGCLWSGWTRIDNAHPSNLTFVGRPVVGMNQDGRLEVFARGADNAVYHIWQCPKGSGCDWSAWTRIDSAHLSSLSFAGNPAIAVNQDGRLEVFARGSDNALWHIWQCPQGSGCDWSAWSSLGGVWDGDPVAARDGSGPLEVSIHGVQNRTWHIGQACPGCGWSSWIYSIGGFSMGNPALVLDANGQLLTFVHGGPDNLFHS
jgi:hypothetical protein